MEMLYALLVAIALVLVWRGITLFMEWRSRLRLKIEPVPPGPDIESMPNPELGKMRVVHRPEPAVLVATELEQRVAQEVEQGVQQEVDSVPVLLTNDEPTFLVKVEAPSIEEDAFVEEEIMPVAMDTDDAPVLVMPASVQEEAKVAEQQDMFADEPIAPPPDRRQTASRAQALYGESSVVEPVRPVAPAAEKAPLEIEKVIALHVVCRAEPFNGEDLLRAVLGYGLRFGDMSIFHRHEQPSGQGRVLFSMAKAVEPGTFSLEDMTGEEIPGVSFFLGLPGVSSITAYDIMIDTARRLAMELQGDVLDEQQQPLTRQLVEHYREQVQEFERRRLMSRSGER